jgi:hypothetical protein
VRHLLAILLIAILTMWLVGCSVTRGAPVQMEPVMYVFVKEVGVPRWIDGEWRRGVQYLYREEKGVIEIVYPKYEGLRHEFSMPK